jgi:hypothetical protein
MSSHLARMVRSLHDSPSMCSRLALVAAVLLAGCQFDSSGLFGEGQGDDGGGEPVDDGGDNAEPMDNPPPQNPPAGEGPPVDGAAHLPPEAAYGGTADLTLTGGTIDTDDLTLPGAIPDGVFFDLWFQSSGPDLAVLHVRRLDIPEGTVTVVGSAALIVIAADHIAIGGTLDAGAHLDQPGPGGSAPAQGDGVGGAGERTGSDRDSGGGGAGSALAGAEGGDATTNIPFIADSDGGVGGGPHLDNQLPVLIGGSGGGEGSGCFGTPGGGGGAVQLTSATFIEVRGAVLAGGGGGGGGLGEGDDVGACGGFGSGSGGGGGGAIVIQAPDADLSGDLSANGGGGGGGGGESGRGGDGADGARGGILAPGGAGGGNLAADGGDGGVQDTDAQAGGDDDSGDGNGGGGGGAAGIVVTLPS